MKKLIFLLSLLVLAFGASACTDGPAYFSVEPELTSPDFMIVGFWEDVAGTWGDKRLVCPVELTIHAPVPITISSGKVETCTSCAYFSYVRDIETKEVERLWGSLEVIGHVTGMYSFNPKVLNTGYRATVLFDYDGSPKLPQLTGTLSHAWECLPPN